MKESIGTHHYDPGNNEFHVSSKRTKKVTQRIKEVYRCLYKNKNELVSMETIMDNVFGEGNHDIDKLYVYISKLKRIIENHPGSGIRNVRGKGYKLIVPVTP
ncbi:helix-turn-helix domain-containing protein [Chitinophaga sp.]|uniref:winged helix-turn-helix domain-containing protein n=1 Tax=Chitinophaga sp. TaxID=1869181 RepID=UPI002C31ED6A|nr:helix-turn-helix domain-containing protein [Chitinophaga sp.]HWV64379.1 helix-turn-helix domain-containing protein [Chitinophaga sp.]